MKNLYKIIITFLSASLLVSGCSNSNNKKDMIDFQKITIVNNNCTAANYIYEAEVDENGVWLRAGIEYMGDEEDEPDYYREVHADEDVKQQISKKLQDCNVTSWDGFNKSNSNVMDGSSFSLNITLDDDSSIEAHGSNTSPKNYSDFESFILDLILVEEISEPQFAGFNLEMTLPDYWIGNTLARFDETGFTFYLVDEESEDYILFVDINSYGYSDSYKHAISAGRLMKDGGDEYYVTLRADISVATGNKEYTKDKAKIIDGLQEDALTIAESIQGINDYTFISNN